MGRWLQPDGVDYLVTRDAPVLLEVNAYPGLSDVPGAEDAFLAELARWWRAPATS